MEICQFKIENLKEIVEIQKECFPDEGFFSETTFLSFFSNFPSGFLVAKQKEEIVGYGICQKEKNVGKIVSLAVKPKWQKNGIGTQLLRNLIEILRENEVRKIFLHVRVGNFIAISLYKSFGFKILKRVKNYYLNGEDAYLMSLNFPKKNFKI